ncbi:MAG: ArsR family transcriptional regulator [Candidatus Hadarchaeum sp.]|uniref:ArsR family transcriptional regulator n=1 Tax=Candidatus Hadarchaeum sp. TaxID=2883567 RepID=UPI003D12C146
MEDWGKIHEAAELLGIKSTGKKILNLLARTERKLSVAEIVAGTKRSERAVKEHLKKLVDLKLVQREISVTEKGRLAYRYFRLHSDDFFRTVKQEIDRRLRRLGPRGKKETD